LGRDEFDRYQGVVGYRREKMYGVWWSGAKQDVGPAEGGATGYNWVTLQHTSGHTI
jgi:branched-chain amino acid transport system substrate-binding protein